MQTLSFHGYVCLKLPPSFNVKTIFSYVKYIFLDRLWEMKVSHFYMTPDILPWILNYYVTTYLYVLSRKESSFVAERKKLFLEHYLISYLANLSTLLDAKTLNTIHHLMMIV